MGVMAESEAEADDRRSRSTSSPASATPQRRCIRRLRLWRLLRCLVGSKGGGGRTRTSRRGWCRSWPRPTWCSSSSPCTSTTAPSTLPPVSPLSSAASPSSPPRKTPSSAPLLSRNVQSIHSISHEDIKFRPHQINFIFLFSKSDQIGQDGGSRCR